MLYRSWDRFAHASEELAHISQRPTRTCLRWRHEAGLLVIRVTDDSKTLTFKARSVVYLNRFELLNRRLTAQYRNRRQSVDPSRPALDFFDSSGGDPSPSDIKGPPASDAHAGSSVGGAGGAGGLEGGKSKKKKGKKGK